ncbi:MAG: hypothetical protein NC293_09005 [Roseburia sp.]|nr:hypothetical protein [Roseburia sp.]
MNKLLKEIKTLENKMNEYETATEYWIERENLEESGKYEKMADVIYEKIYELLNQAADKIVSITSGQVDKVTAMEMIRCRRSEVERIFR